MHNRKIKCLQCGRKSKLTLVLPAEAHTAYKLFFPQCWIVERTKKGNIKRTFCSKVCRNEREWLEDCGVYKRGEGD